MQTLVRVVVSDLKMEKVSLSSLQRTRRALTNMRSRHVARISAQLGGEDGGGGGYGSVGHRDEPSAAQGGPFECHVFLWSIKLLALLPLVLSDGSKILLLIDQVPCWTP